MFVDLNDPRFSFSPEDAPGIIRNDLDDYLRRTGLSKYVTPQEADEIAAELAKNGGEAEYLVERVFERSADFVEKADEPADEILGSIPFGEPAGPNAGGLGRSVPVQRQAAGSRADTGRGQAAFEATDAGEQSLVPGVDPVTERQRLEAAQDAPLRGGETPADDGLFDLNARAQVDMFDDLASPEAVSVRKTMLTDIKQQIDDAGDFDVDIEMDDGTRFSKASDLVRHIEEADEFADVIALCGRGQE